MRKFLLAAMLPLAAVPLAAHANYYDGRGGYHITPAPSSTIYTPQGVWTISPNNPVQPNGGYTIYAPSAAPPIVAPSAVGPEYPAYPPGAKLPAGLIRTDDAMRNMQRDWERRH